MNNLDEETIVHDLSMVAYRFSTVVNSIISTDEPITTTMAYQLESLDTLRKQLSDYTEKH